MLNLMLSEIVARRVFSPLYIALDSVFIAGLLTALLVKKRYLTTLFAVFGGVLYMIVDYGIFHLALGTRKIENGNLFWVLLWMSMSYGITNFALIWIWWICCPMISATFGGDLTPIKIQRTTGSYHGYMALFMIASYAGIIIYNLTCKQKERKFNIVWLFTLGVLAQLGWEVGLLIGGIRSEGFDPFTKIMTLVTNSLVETNLGLPAIYCSYLAVTSRLDEQLKRRDGAVPFLTRLEESNAATYRRKEKAAA